MKFLRAIGSFFKNLFTFHNAKAVLTTAERAAETVVSAETGNIAAAVTEATATVSAAESITVVQKVPALTLVPTESSKS